MTITLEQARDHLRVLHDDEDTAIRGYLAAAVAWVERYTGHLLHIREVTDTFAAFTPRLKLSKGPFVALTSVAYVSADGAPSTFAGAPHLDGYLYPPVAGWPLAQPLSSIAVTYEAGFETTPPDLDAAVLLLVGHWFANREAVNVGNIVTEMPLAVEALAGPFRTPTLA